MKVLQRHLAEGESGGAEIERESVLVKIFYGQDILYRICSVENIFYDKTFYENVLERHVAEEAGRERGGGGDGEGERRRGGREESQSHLLRYY